MVYSVSIVTPAYRAERTLLRAARSVLDQSHQDWEWIVVADDDADYETLLAAQGLRDDRMRFLTTGGTGTGSPPARNLGLDAASHRFAAILDADDYLHPEKLATMLPPAAEHGLVSCALDVVDARGNHLRTVGAGLDILLPAGRYKFTNISMDSMLVYDRRKADPRFNPEFPCLTDIEFLLRLFADNSAAFHVGRPLHAYVKQPGSISNKPGATERMIQTKRRILQLLTAGAYPLADADGVSGLRTFYEISLRAEQGFGRKLAADPALLFEDHLQEELKRHGLAGHDLARHDPA